MSGLTSFYLMLASLVAYFALSFYFESRRRKSRTSINRGKDISPPVAFIHRFGIILTIPLLVLLGRLGYGKFIGYIFFLFFIADKMLLGIYAGVTGKFIIPSRGRSFYFLTNENSRIGKKGITTKIGGWISLLFSSSLLFVGIWLMVLYA